MSMANYSSVRASIGSLSVILLTLFLIYFGFGQIFAFFDFAIFSAVWEDQRVEKEKFAGQLSRVESSLMAGMELVGLT